MLMGLILVLFIFLAWITSVNVYHITLKDINQTIFWGDIFSLNTKEKFFPKYKGILEFFP